MPVTFGSKVLRFVAAPVVVFLMGLAVGVILAWWALGLYLSIVVLLGVTSRRLAYRSRNTPA
jgi:hypothetical protein